MIRLVLALILLTTGCTSRTERSGVVVDQRTRQPLPGVSVAVYLGHITHDTLQLQVVTDSSGYFFIPEKRSSDQLFALSLEGYIGYVSTLPTAGDTLLLEPN